MCLIQTWSKWNRNYILGHLLSFVIQSTISIMLIFALLHSKTHLKICYLSQQLQKSIFKVDSQFVHGHKISKEINWTLVQFNTRFSTIIGMHSATHYYICINALLQCTIHFQMIWIFSLIFLSGISKCICSLEFYNESGAIMLNCEDYYLVSICYILNVFLMMFPMQISLSFQSKN